MMLGLTRFVASTITLAGALAACQSPPATHMAVTNQQETAVPVCHAESAYHLIGQKVSDDVINQALNDSGAGVSRVLGPNDPATLDFSQSRLNLITDAQGMIESLHCG